MDKNTLRRYLYYSYLEARKHKSKTKSHIRFQENLESNLDKLCDDIYNGCYQISPSIYFIQKNPIQREVFAWNFRDRIVHHLVFDCISPYWEKQFIYDSYSCRKGKWTSKWIERIAKFMRACSNNFTKEWWILKMDIQWYFMSIDRDLLREKNYQLLKNWNKLVWMHPKNKLYILSPITGDFPDYLVKVIHDIIYNDPTVWWIFKWRPSDYEWLPKTKSLFYTWENCGLPIWNLTSQLFSNIYLNDFDHFVKENLWVKYYGRYVDDFVLIHNDKEYLKRLIPIMRDYLKDKEKLTLHPNKIYLQPIKHGVQFLGAIIKPYHSFRAKRTLSNFNRTLKETNNNPARASLDSYLWLLAHYRHYHLIQKILSKVNLYDSENVSDYALSFLEKDKFYEIVRNRNKIDF